MEESDDQTQVINPIQLTLDEIIALNKLNNRPSEQSILEGHEEDTPLNGYVKEEKQDFYKQQMDERLRRIPEFGSKPIHDRLGWHPSVKKSKFKPANKKLPYFQMRRLVERAKLQTWNSRKKDFKFPLFLVQNKESVSPLTSQSLSVFDRLNGSRMTVNGASPQSVFSAKTSLSHQPRRHCIRNHLTESIQLDIKKMLMDICPNERNQAVKECQVSPAMTSLLLGDRFSTYE